MIQDCYQKLLARGGLDSFQAPPGREAGEAFGAWLWTVVHRHCNNKVHYLQNSVVGLLNIKQNQIVKVYTNINAVFLPPTLVATFYGINFAVMQELSW